MSRGKRILMTCIDCGIKQYVHRVELDRARQPHCEACQGPLEASKRARKAFADARAARAKQYGDKDPERYKPLLDQWAKTGGRRRYEFHIWPNLYDWARTNEAIPKEGRKAMFPKFTPEEFYDELTPGGKMKPENIYGAWLVNRTEQLWWRSGKPYYKVWPSMAAALCHTEMRIDGQYLHLPFEALTICLPKQDNPLRFGAALVGRLDPETTVSDDDREWSLIVGTLDQIPPPKNTGDDTSRYWMGNIPVKSGMSLEDSLDQTKLMEDCDDPDSVRQLMRLAVGICFFGIDNHEVVMPDLKRRTIERAISQKRAGKEEQALRRIAREAAEVVGYMVGSEIDLPTPEIRYVDRGVDGPPKRELATSHVRRGHLRLQPVGKERKDRKLIFVPPTIVRPDLPLRTTRGFRIRPPKEQSQCTPSNVDDATES